jgi:hypothetical protein
VKRENSNNSKKPRKKYQNTKQFSVPNKKFLTKVANGTRVLEGVDGRSQIARRYSEVAGRIARDLGGDDVLTELQRHLIRSVSGLVVLREKLDAKIVNGESINTAQYCRIANSTRRVAATLGLSRVPRDVTPDPLSYAASYDRHTFASANGAALD